MLLDFVPKWEIYLVIGIFVLFALFIVFKFIQEEKQEKEKINREGLDKEKTKDKK